jgi:hypothetical protein
MGLLSLAYDVGHKERYQNRPMIRDCWAMRLPAPAGYTQHTEEGSLLRSPLQTSKTDPLCQALKAHQGKSEREK